MLLVGVGAECAVGAAGGIIRYWGWAVERDPATNSCSNEPRALSACRKSPHVGSLDEVVVSQQSADGADDVLHALARLETAHGAA